MIYRRYRNLFFVLLALCGASQDAVAQSQILCSLFVRVPHHIDVQDAVGALTDDDLINDVVLNHLYTYRRGLPKHRTANWRKVDFSWLLLPEYEELYERLLTRFETFSSLSLDAWLSKLEGVYTGAGLELADTWTKGWSGVPGRKRFVRRMVLRLALRAQGIIGFSRGPLLWSTKPEANAFLNSMSADIAYAFGTAAVMQDHYDVFYRQQNGVVVPKPEPGAVGQRQAAAVARLRAAGVSIREIWTPWVTAEKRRRARAATIEDWLEAIRYWQEEYLPLVPLLVIDDNDRMDWSRAQAVVGNWNGLRPFVQALNQQFRARGLPLVSIGVGIDDRNDNFREMHWRRELLVQACLLQIRLHDRQTPFTDFSLDSTGREYKENPYKINPTGSLWTEARMTIQELNTAIFLRRIEPPLPE